MNAARLGVLSAFTASACCVGPAALAAAGLGGLGLGIFVVRFSSVLVVGAAILLVVGWRRYLAEHRRCAQAQCRMGSGKAALITLSLASVIVAGFAVMHMGPLFSKAACAVSCPR